MSPKTSPKISIVVPVHNVEPYLEECLLSIAGQTLRDLEVIMVDDGSTDGSPVIAKAFAARDQRFRLVHQDNRGLGPARNTGVRHARGRYLAFADSDDVVPADAYQSMVSSLEASGSDLACGNVHRLEADGRTSQSALHRKVFTAARRTHVSRDLLLVRDRTAWNKVFRRSFWDAHRFEFPAGWYEDSPVTMHAHAVAEAVDVVGTVVYLWRRRPDSISEGRADAGNIAQRLAVMARVRRMLAELNPRLVPAFDAHALLDVDVRILLGSLPSIADAEQPPLIDLGAELVSQVDPRVLDERPAGERMLLRLLALRMLPELREVLRDRLLGGGPRAVRRGSRWYADYPFVKEPCDITDEIKPVAKVDRAQWTGDLLQVEGHAYLSGLYAAGPEDLEIRLWLRRGDGPLERLGRLRGRGRLGRLLGRLDRLGLRYGRPLGVAVAGERLRRSDLAHEGSGFVASIDPATLRGRVLRRGRVWRLCVEMAAPGIARRRFVGSTPVVMKQPPAERRVAPGVLARPVVGKDSLALEIVTGRAAAPRTPPPVVDWRAVVEEELLCTGIDPCDGDREEYRRTREWLIGPRRPAPAPAPAAAPARHARHARPEPVPAPVRPPAAVPPYVPDQRVPVEGVPQAAHGLSRHPEGLRGAVPPDGGTAGRPLR